MSAKNSIDIVGGVFRFCGITACLNYVNRMLVMFVGMLLNKELFILAVDWYIAGSIRSGSLLLLMFRVFCFHFSANRVYSFWSFLQ